MKSRIDSIQIKTIKNKKDLCQEDFDYDYNIDLTKELDTIAGDLNKDIINKIVLWKLNRYPRLTNEIIGKLNRIKDDRKIGNKHEELLFDLLGCYGVQLPMASTFLRFRNPALFQIIDQRAYRILTGNKLKLPSLATNSQKSKQRTCKIYFEYLEQLLEKCEELQIPFEKSDRILYKADIRINKNLPLANY